MAKIDIAIDQKIIEQLGYTGEDGLVLLLRIHLVRAIKEDITQKGWSQQKAADFLGIKQPRISELMQLRIDQFSVEILSKFLFRLGKTVTLSVNS